MSTESPKLSREECLTWLDFSVKFQDQHSNLTARDKFADCAAHFRSMMAEIEDAERRCDEWREQASADSALAVANERFKKEIARLTAEREAAVAEIARLNEKYSVGGLLRRVEELESELEQHNP